MTTKHKPAIQNILQRMDDLRQLGTYYSSHYTLVDQLVSDLKALQQNQQLSAEDISTINTYYGVDFLEQSMMGRSLSKPYGYAGDFELIDQIYQQRTAATTPFFTFLDQYVHRQSATIAVRNRKEYFKQLLLYYCAKHNKPLRLLNVASGPARDLAELYDLLPAPQRLHTSCLDMDEHAIAYAQQLIDDNLPVRFVHKNIFRYQADRPYDFIWSAGLFDYFDGKGFLLLLKRFRSWLAPGGSIVIGNFNEDHNPSRPYMELLGEWFLHHRTEQQLLDLGLAVGFAASQLSVEREPEGVNLFLRVNQ